jgi:iron(III) transport system substrate-binding protein
MKRRGLLLRFLAISVIAVVATLAALVSATPEQLERTLVLITPSNPNLLDAVVGAFKNYVKTKYGVDIEVRLIRAGTPECMNRIIAWGGRPEADIFYGGDLIYHWKLKERGLLESYKPKSPYYDALPSNFLGFPLKDPDEMWHPKLWWGHGFMYNTEVIRKLNLETPKSWEAFLDPEWKDLIVMCTPSRSSSTYINVALIIMRKGEREGWAFWRRLASNVGAFVPRSHDVIELVSKGEYAVGFAHSQGVVFARAQGYPVTMYMDPTGFIVSGVSLLKGAPHPNLAKLFLDWWYTPEAQQAALSAGGIPVLPDVKIEGPPGSPAAMLKEFLGGYDNIYDYLKSFREVKFYDSTLAEKMYTNVSKTFDDNIVAKHSELKDAWSTILAVKEKVKGYPEAEAKLDEAISLFDGGNYAAAKAAAVEAERIAVQTVERQRIMTIAAAAVAAVVVLVAAAFIVRRRFSKKAQK